MQLLAQGLIGALESVLDQTTKDLFVTKRTLQERNTLLKIEILPKNLSLKTIVLRK